MDITRSAERLAHEYEKQPLNFNNESDIQYRLSKYVQKELEKRGEEDTTTTKGFDTQTDGSAPVYANKYHSMLKKQLIVNRYPVFEQN